MQENNVVYASFWIRLGAFIIDYGLMLLFLFSLIVIGFDWTESLNEYIGYLIFFPYHIIFLSIFSSTPGKKIFGLKVVDEKSGLPINPKRALFRGFAYIGSSIFFGVGFLRIFKDLKRQAWHDKAVGTCVVVEKKRKLLVPTLLTIVSVVFLAFVYWYGSEDVEYVSESEVVIESSYDVASAVVNIWCPYFDESLSFESLGSGGSGTVITEDGLIITNSHIIPQDEFVVDVAEEGCLVVFPDSDTGEPKEVYIGSPLVVGEISDTYDLAFVEIIDVYVDDEGYSYGQYPNTFPYLDDSVCTDEPLTLGEPVKVYGYPNLTGGYSLTITEGVVSSIADGYIYTSAKIDSGNSGGIAVDKYGCSVGIPTMVVEGDMESMGVLISSETLNEFVNEIEQLLE